MKYLIVGLGNPGMQYAATRHNIGFDVVDAFAKRFSIDVINKKFNALVGTGVAEGHKVVLVKPQTYMNLSGESVRRVLDFYKVDETQELIVISDDISLEIAYQKKGKCRRSQWIKKYHSPFGPW